MIVVGCRTAELLVVAAVKDVALEIGFDLRVAGQFFGKLSTCHRGTAVNAVNDTSVSHLLHLGFVKTHELFAEI